jgi:hypothetical protein
MDNKAPLGEQGEIEIITSLFVFCQIKFIGPLSLD